MAQFDAATLDELTSEREVHVRTQGRDGSDTDLPIWVVTVDRDAYVRSVRGGQGQWWRRARDAGHMTLVAGGQPLSVVVDPVTDTELNERVSEAYAAKYGLAGPGETMAHEVADTTLRVSPAP